MKLYEMRYGETITVECLDPECNFEFELTLEPLARDMTERERYSMPIVTAKFCPFCGVQNLDINYEPGDEPPE
jgi:hypothetical protein